MHCRERLITQGRSNIDAVRQSLVKAQTVNEIKALHLKEFCWDVMAVPAAQMLPVGQISYMPIRKLSQAESLRLQQVHKPQVQQYAVLGTSACFAMYLS